MTIATTATVGSLKCRAGSADVVVNVPHGAGRRRARSRHQLSHALEGSKHSFGVAAVQDVTDRRSLADVLVHRATHDALTGLPNRALFMDRLAHALARAGRSQATLAAMFLDLDHFKLVNDTSGHEAGDMVLVAMTQRLRGALRPSDTIARFGGDEFVVLCEDLASHGDAVQIAQRIVDACNQPLQIGACEYVVSVSAGVAIVDDAARAVPSDVLRDADAAMYRAKAIGRGRVEVFDARMRARLTERMTIESDLRHALERGELRVHYQPVVSLSRNEIVGAEALLRWAHPVRGLLEPAQFLDVAESSGLIVPIGAWLIEEACQQAARWRDARPERGIQVLVNASLRQLVRADLTSLVAGVLRSTGLASELLGFEIKESMLLADEQASARTLHELKAIGVRLLLDDFGGGFSSLSDLKRFTIDALKLDHAYVDGLGRDPVAEAIVDAVVSIANALDVGVTAKGVETPEQLSRLRAHGCPLAQGYLFARPGPAAALEALLDGELPSRP